MRGRPWPRSILGLGAAASLMAGLVTLALGATTLTMVRREVERQLDHQVELEATYLRTVYRDRGLAGVAEIVRQRDQLEALASATPRAAQHEAGRGMGYIVSDAEGRRVAGSLNADLPPRGWSENLRIVRTDGSEGVARALSVDLGAAGSLVVAADRSALRRGGKQALRLIAVQVGAVTLIVVLTVAGFGRLVHLRLAAIRDSARAIIAGDLTRRMPVRRDDSEFDQLGVELNRMLDRIAALMASLRQVSSDIAHDLRTPLTRLRHSIEAAGATSDPALYRERLDAALEEADGALDLFAGLLAISEVEGQDVRARFRPVQLDEAVRKIAEAYEPSLENAGITVDLDLQSSTVTGDEALLQRLAASLLDNLIAHTPSGTHGVLQLRNLGARTRLSLQDDGPGVPNGATPRIFERLVRADPARSGPGHGLGLSLVAAVAAAHGGTVSARDATPGLRIDLDFPTG